MDMQGNILNDYDDKIIGTQEIQLDSNIRGLGEELYKAMVRHKNRIAQIDAESGKTETFATMLERCVRVAVNLKRMGVTPEDILTPCTDNHQNTAVIFIAILLTGAKVASIDPFSPDDDRIKQLAVIKPKMMFCSTNALERAVDMIKELRLNTKIVVFGESEEYMTFQQLLIPHLDQERVFSPYIPNSLFETVMIVFSSGTTGNPHAICAHNYGFCALFCLPGFNFMNSTNEQLTVLIYSSLVWMSAIMNICSNTIHGNIRITCSSFAPDKTWRYIQKYKVTDLMLVCPDLLALVNSERPAGLDISSLKQILTGAAPISSESIRRVVAQFPGVAVLLGYGQTETCGGGTVIRFDDTNDLIHTKSASIGLPVSGLLVKIVDSDTEEILGPNQIGEYRVKSKRNMNGYYNDDGSACFDADGFLKSGDLCYYDQDGYFYFVERLKEVLRYKMCAINPSELEHILQEYPGVEFAVVIGVSSDGGDLPVGVIVRKDNNINENELQLFLSKRVDERKRLHGGIMFVDRSYIPFTPSGKVNRRRLRAKVFQDLN